MENIEDISVRRGENFPRYSNWYSRARFLVRTKKQYISFREFNLIFNPAKWGGGGVDSRRCPFENSIAIGTQTNTSPPPVEYFKPTRTRITMKSAGARPVWNERNPSLNRVQVPNLSKSLRQIPVRGMKISVEKYPLGRNKKRFLFSREKLRSRYTRYSSSDAHGGTSSPSLVSLVERKFACTRTKVQNHDFTERDGTIDRGGKREGKREGGSEQRRSLFPDRCVIPVFSRWHGKSAPSISPRAFKSWKPERKSNFARGRRAGLARGSKRRESPLPLLENTDSPRNAFQLIEAPNRLPFRFQFNPVYA